MKAALHSVITEHDTHGARALGQASDPDKGVVVASVAPNLRRRFELGWALLEALGKSQDVSGHGRHDELNWEVLHAWLLAHRTAHLVLLDAQWLPLALIADLAGLVASCGVNVWLVAHHPVEQPYLDALDKWPHKSEKGGGLVEVLKSSMGNHLTSKVVKAPFPDVPTDNWPTFRFACAQALSPGDFEVVDVAFHRAFAEALPFFSRAEMNEAAMVVHLRETLNQCVSVAEMITTVRAVQVAAHRSGWLLQADPVRILNTAHAMSRSAINAPETWERLRAYRLPYRGAAVAMAAVGMNIEAMERLSCGGANEEGTAVTLDETTVAISSGAAVFVRGQLAYRRIMGAKGSDPFFADENGPHNDRVLADALRAPARELGVSVPEIATGRTPDPTSKRWKDRWGLALLKLSS